MATIKELAKKAGVSPSTASIVVNGKARERKISKETEMRVLKVAREIGYTPNLSARSLRDHKRIGKVRIAVFWTTDYRLSLMVKFLRGLQEAILEQDTPIEIVVITYINGKLIETATPHSLLSYHAAIFCNANADDLESLNQTQFHIPIVLYNRYLERFSTVNIDNYDMGVTAANMSIKNNRKNILLLDQDQHFPGIENRIAGFYDTLNKHNLKCNHQVVAHDRKEGFKMAQKLHKKNQLPDFVFSLSDFAAFGFMNYLVSQAINIPKDIDILAIGTMEKEFYEVPSIPLSTIDVPMEEMAKECLQLALYHIKDPLAKLKTSIIPIQYNYRQSSL